MDENEKSTIKGLVELKNHLLVWKATGKRVKRVALGYVKLAGKVWRTRDVFSVLMEESVDRRITASFEMARSLPEMEITRVDARALGLKVYRTGRPCFKGHIGWRFVSNGACITCKGLLK